MTPDESYYCSGCQLFTNLTKNSLNQHSLNQQKIKTVGVKGDKYATHPPVYRALLNKILKIFY